MFLKHSVCTRLCEVLALHFPRLAHSNHVRCLFVLSHFTDEETETERGSHAQGHTAGYCLGEDVSTDNQTSGSEHRLTAKLSGSLLREWKVERHT